MVWTPSASAHPNRCSRRRMNQAARRKSKSRSKSGGKRMNSSSWGMLIIGLVSGSVLAALLISSQGGTYGGFGSGLKALFERVTDPGAEIEQEQNVATQASPRPKLDFYTVLPKIERIIPDDPRPGRREEVRKARTRKRGMCSRSQPIRASRTRTS